MSIIKKELNDDTFVHIQPYEKWALRLGRTPGEHMERLCQDLIDKLNDRDNFEGDTGELEFETFRDAVIERRYDYICSNGCRHPTKAEALQCSLGFEAPYRSWKISYHSDSQKRYRSVKYCDFDGLTEAYYDFPDLKIESGPELESDEQEFLNRVKATALMEKFGEGKKEI